MTELAIRPEDIRSAIERHVEAFTPETTREEVGRVTETGDGIARVEGLTFHEIPSPAPLPHRYLLCGCRFGIHAIPI